MTRRRGHRTEDGAVAVVVALLFSAILLAVAAVGVDTARWYVERERLQNAADAAALAGVVYLPADLTNAIRTAQAAAERNGYKNGVDDTTVTVTQGERPSQLRVTIDRTIGNQFGAAVGVDTATLSMTAVADYTGPAPMGSPCNTFANQPPSQAHAQPPGFAGVTVTHTSCKDRPQFWAAVEGPATDKVQGDRYSTLRCTTGTFGCAGTTNSEKRAEGFYFAVKVGQAAVDARKRIQVQIYDPAYVHTEINCSVLPPRSDISSDDLNDYAKTDARSRYSRPASASATDVSRPYCSGDYNPGSGVATNPPTTSFALREQTDTNDPMKAPIISGCSAQYSPVRTYSMSNLTKKESTYNQEFSRVFHQWVKLCDFTPTRAGDYYLQVRTNVTTSGGVGTPNNKTNAAIEFRGNPALATTTSNITSTGQGLNAFSLRAVDANNPTVPLGDVSVSGWDRMPILQNAPSSTAVFDLIRVLPAARGQSINFEFFDAADGAGSKSAFVRVIRPTDAIGKIRDTTNIAGCKGAMDTSTSYTDLPNCTATVRGTTHNGKLQKMSIPIPADYNCAAGDPGGCWFQVELRFPDINVTDFTTWDANIGGDPVRLIE